MTIDQARKSYKVALDIAKSGKGDIESIVDAIARSAAGTTMQLQRLIGKTEESFSGAVTHTDLMALAIERFGGRAEAQIGKINTQVDKLKEAAGELEEAFGARLLDVAIGDASSLNKFTDALFGLADLVAPSNPDNPAAGIEALRRELALLEKASEMPKFSAFSLSNLPLFQFRLASSGIASLIDFITGSSESLRNQISDLEAYGDQASAVDLEIAKVADDIRRVQDNMRILESLGQVHWPQWEALNDEMSDLTRQMDDLITKQRAFNEEAAKTPPANLRQSLLAGIGEPGPMSGLGSEDFLKSLKDAHDKIIKERKSFFDRWDRIIEERAFAREDLAIEMREIERQAAREGGFGPSNQELIEGRADQLNEELGLLRDIMSQETMTRESAIANAKRYRQVMFELIAIEEKRLKNLGIPEETISAITIKRVQDVMKESDAIIRDSLTGLRGWVVDLSADLNAAFENTFFRTMKGQFESFYAFIESITDVFVRSVSQKMANVLMNPKGTGWLDNLLNIGGGSGAVGTSNVGGPSIPVPTPMPDDISGFATGGLVMRPTLAMVGEAGPELIVPLSKMNNGTFLSSLGDGWRERGGAAGEVPTIINFQITTPDPGSFKASQSQIMSQAAVVLGRARRNL